MSATTNYIQVHPTFLYESMWNLCLMLVLILFTKHKKFSGQVLTLYMFGYGLGRFLIEGIRTDVLYVGHTHIAASQVVCVVIMALAVIMNVVALIMKPGKKPENVIQEAEPDKTSQEAEPDKTSHD